MDVCLGFWIWVSSDGYDLCKTGWGQCMGGGTAWMAVEMAESNLCISGCSLVGLCLEGGPVGSAVQWGAGFNISFQ